MKWPLFLREGSIISLIATGSFLNSTSAPQLGRRDGLNPFRLGFVVPDYSAGDVPAGGVIAIISPGKQGLLPLVLH